VVPWAVHRRAVAVLAGLRALSQAFCRLFGFWTSVVVGQFQARLSSVLPLTIEGVPDVALAAAGNDDFGQADPSFANELRLLVVVEDGHLEAVIVGRLVHGEAKFLIPIVIMLAS
jgi:hypothetical protein